MNWVAEHFRRYLEREPWDFCWRLGLESVVVGLPAVVVFGVVFGPPKPGILDLPVLEASVLLLVFAPLVETLIFQAFPIFIVRVLKGSIRAQILISTLLFSAVHFPQGIASGVAAGVICGLYLAFAYAHWRTRSRWQSFWITAVCHAIHNGILFTFLVGCGAWS